MDDGVFRHTGMQTEGMTVFFQAGLLRGAVIGLGHEGGQTPEIVHRLDVCTTVDPGIPQLRAVEFIADAMVDLGGNARKADRVKRREIGRSVFAGDGIVPCGKQFLYGHDGSPFHQQQTAGSGINARVHLLKTVCFVAFCVDSDQRTRVILS